jgi:hypothetical protein
MTQVSYRIIVVCVTNIFKSTEAYVQSTATSCRKFMHVGTVLALSFLTAFSNKIPQVSK